MVHPSSSARKRQSCQTAMTKPGECNGIYTNQVLFPLQVQVPPLLFILYPLFHNIKLLLDIYLNSLPLTSFPQENGFNHSCNRHPGAGQGRHRHRSSPQAPGRLPDCQGQGSCPEPNRLEAHCLPPNQGDPYWMWYVKSFMLFGSTPLLLPQLSSTQL